MVLRNVISNKKNNQLILRNMLVKDIILQYYQFILNKDNQEKISHLVE